MLKLSIQIGGAAGTYNACDAMEGTNVSFRRWARPYHWLLQSILVHVPLKRSKTAADSLVLLQCSPACLQELFMHGCSPEGCCLLFGNVFPTSARSSDAVYACANCFCYCLYRSLSKCNTRPPENRFEVTGAGPFTPSWWSGPGSLASFLTGTPPQSGSPGGGTPGSRMM